MPARRSRADLESLVVELIARSNQPVSAYDIARHSAAAGHPIVPNQVYRTLGRLLSRGHIVRLESLSAYMVRQEPFDSCLICDHCRSVQLISNPDLLARLAASARTLGFRAARTVIETRGCCADCSPDARPTG